MPPDLRDTPKNRERVQAKAVIMSHEIKESTFDYLKWFPDGNRTEKFKPIANVGRATGEKTVEEYFTD